MPYVATLVCVVCGTHFTGTHMCTQSYVNLPIHCGLCGQNWVQHPHVCKAVGPIKDAASEYARGLADGERRVLERLRVLLEGKRAGLLSSADCEDWLRQDCLAAEQRAKKTEEKP
jgi:hypothetical protein